MTRLAFPALLALGLLGCASEPEATLSPNVTYITEWIGDDAVIGRTPLSLVLGDDGRAFGNAGCNHWFATYSLDGQQLHFSDLASTRKLCAEPIMQQEDAFLSLLGKVERWDVSKIDQLRLWPADGAPIRLWPALD